MGSDDQLALVVVMPIALALCGLLVRYQRTHRTGLAKPIGRPRSVELQWHGSIGDAFEHVSAMLRSVGAEILDLDVSAGTITAATKPGANNSGFSIAVTIQARDQEVTVLTEAWPTVGLLDFGATRRFLERYALAFKAANRIEV